MSSLVRFAKKARLRFDLHSGKHMILYPERVLELNDSAAAIAQKIDGTRDVVTIVRELVAEHGGKEEDIARDVDEVLTALRDKGVVEVG